MVPAPDSLRIGMIAPGYPTGAPGDYRGIFVKRMVEHLKQDGHRLCVLTSAIRPDDPRFQRVDEAEEIHRFRFWSEGKLVGEYDRVPVARMATYLASAYWTGSRVFRRFGCDILHSHFLVPMGPVGAAISIRLRRPHLITGHGREVHMAAGNRAIRPLARWALRHAERVTATAEHLVPSLTSLGASSGRIAKLPMGIFGPFLESVPAAGEPGPGALRRIISTRTLLENPYNVSQLIRAMRLVVDCHPDVQCTLAGEGADRPALEALVRELRLENHVKFIGWADSARLADLLRTHGLYVSTMKADGASVSLFEAMACGSYPILTDTPPNREWVRDGDNGRLFPLDDPPALAVAIEQALADPEAAARAAQRNRRTVVENLTWPGLARRLEALYREILTERGQAVYAS